MGRTAKERQQIFLHFRLITNCYWNKTLTAVVGTEPGVGAQAAAVQRLQSFVTESRWEVTALNQRRLEVLQADPRTTTHAGGVLILDGTGDRKSGTHTAHIERHYLGSVGKIENGIVVVSTLWADEEQYYPLHAEPYTPARALSTYSRRCDHRSEGEKVSPIVFLRQLRPES